MSETYTRGKMISEVCRDTSYSRGIVTAVMDSILDNITLQLSVGNRIQFAGFGTFEMKERAERTGRNPRTGDAVTIPERFIPSFEPGEALKRATIKTK